MPIVLSTATVVFSGGGRNGAMDVWEYVAV